MLITRGKAVTVLLAVGFLFGFCLPRNVLQVRTMRFSQATERSKLRTARSALDSRPEGRLRPVA